MGHRKKLLGAGLGYAIAGPAGALAGLALSATDAAERGSGLGDVPVGVHVEAEHEDDEVGRRWTLRFLSEVPARSYAVLRLLTDTGQSLPGRRPFANDDDQFAVAQTIRNGRCIVYVPLGAVVYDSPEHISLEVSVWATRHGTAATVGKGVLDAALPPAQPWRVAAYLLPLTSLCARVLAAADDDALEAGVLDAMVARLADALGFDQGARPVETLPAMLAHARAPLSVDAACRIARFRFPELGPDDLVALLLHATALDEGAPPTRHQRALLDRARELLVPAS